MMLDRLLEIHPAMPQFLELLGASSVVTFLGSLLVIPWLIGRLPEDYFIRHRQVVEVRHRRHPALALVILFVRNSSGLLLTLAGIAMLLLPGQGLLTILVGVSLMDFPGKRRFVDSLSANPRMIRVLNWVRRKEKKTPFVF